MRLVMIFALVLTLFGQQQTQKNQPVYAEKLDALTKAVESNRATDYSKEINLLREAVNKVAEKDWLSEWG